MKNSSCYERFLAFCPDWDLQEFLQRSNVQLSEREAIIDITGPNCESFEYDGTMVPRGLRGALK